MTWADEVLRAGASDEDPGGGRSAPPWIRASRKALQRGLRRTPVIRRKLDAIHRARSLRDLRLPAGNRLEELKGTRVGTFSVRVNARYRITFRLEDGHAQDVVCEDHH